MKNNSSLINQTIRRLYQQKRRMLSIQYQQLVKQQIAHTLSSIKTYQTAQSIAIYLPINGEADPRGLLALATAQSKQFYLPIVYSKPVNHLLFAPFNPSTSLKRNQYQILEPDYHPDELITPEQLDLVVVPLVAFDLKGNRLGMGGGYYDRSFSFKIKSPTLSPFLVGCAYSFQQSNQLIKQPWDVPLNALIMENQFKLLC